MGHLTFSLLGKNVNRVFEYRALRRVSGHEKEKITGENCIIYII